MLEKLTTNDTVALKKLRQVVTLGALSIALLHLLCPWLAIDYVTLVLLLIALLPWLAPIFKSLEFPGGWKVEFQDLENAAARADQVGLLAPPKAKSLESAFAFERVAEQDPNLALAGLRIEIEKRLVRIAQRHGIEVKSRGLGALLRDLSRREVLGHQERSVIADLVGLLNSAVHGAELDRRSAEWAVEVGPRLLEALDELAEPAKGAT